MTGVRAVMGAAVAACVLALGCLGDSTGPRELRRGSVAFAPQFSVNALRLVDFTRVRVRLVRPGTTPEQVALDTTIDFPSTADSVRLALTVPLQSGASSEPFDLTLAMINAAGDTVFRGGPIRVTAVAGPVGGQAPGVPMVYVGVGSNAAGVRFRAPVPATAFFGDTAVFAAEALDSSGQVLAGTPILYKVDPQDTSRARVPDPAVGRVVAQAARGPARVIAELLTHQTDTTTLKVQPLPVVIAITSGNAQTGTVGTALSQPLAVRVNAADSLGVEGVVVAFTVTAGGGTLTANTDTTDANGDASVWWTLGAVAGAQTVTATAGALSTAPISATATPAVAVRLAFLVQPTLTAAGLPITPAIQVAIQDASGNTVTTATNGVTLAIASNPGADTLSGTRTVAAVAGVATFSSISLSHASAGYTLVASATGLTSATSAAFSIAAGAATTLALVSGDSQNAAPGTLLSLPIVVRVTDAFGNGVSGHAVTFAIATGGGTVGTPSATTDAAGLASSTWTLGSAPGAQTVAVTATGLSGSPLTVSATAGAGGTTTVSPQLDTLTALNATRTLTAQARDALGNPITGTFTWVSRTPAVATVNASGLVTAVANGSTYVVATEAGGTKDSALIVVQQRIATITVTPGTRSIYLTGTFTFTATAVDGGGTPLPSQPTFTWSTTAPAVATVDTAGRVTAVGLGSAQIRATSGAVTGVANVSVITPITRIAVVVDTVGAFTTDTFTLTSLGLTRRYRAIAHDTLDAVMTGVTFTWVSTNGSVAVMITTTGDTASVTSAANGVTQIQATAQGFTSSPGAFLTVAQVLASIELTPPAATIAVTGTVGLVARGKDANNRYISGGTFTYTSSNPAVATVGASTGLVTGVALGMDTITAASGPITSNVSEITVSSTVPAIISFGRDTVSVGRGSSASIPILLSKPHTGDLTVNLAVADTFAYWSTAAVTIPAGQTSINATLNGRNAGTTTVSAVDGSGAGYSSGSAVAKVTANMRLTSGGYAINATDIVTTQVLLSDPSPAGGTYITFTYSTPGIAAISPDPAFIPAGQLAADIQIRGLAAGSTNITPSAIGVNGTASSFTAYAPVLTLSTSSIRLGQGQYEPNVYVYTPTYTNVPVPVTITSSDTNVVTVTPSVTIPGGSYYAYFTTSSRATGTATITLSAPGWTASGTIAVTVTTPYVGICCGTTLNTTSPLRNVTVYAEDSVRTGHYRTNSLVVRLSSTDTLVMRVLDTLVTIAPGQYYTSAGRVVPGGLGGTAYIVATASGHQADSTLFTVVGPKLNFSWFQNRVGAGQYDPNQYVYTPDYLTAPLVVTVTNDNPTSVTVPSADTIPTGSYYRYFTVQGNVPGTATLIGSAAGYQPDTASYLVTSPRLTACCNYTFSNFGPGSNVTVYSTDSLRSGHYRSTALVVSVASTDTTVVRVDSSTVTIAAGQYYSSQAHLTPVGIGTARIIFAASGHESLDTLTITVTTPKLSFSIYSYTIGRRQHRNPSDFYVYTPDYRPSPLAATITQRNGTVDSLTASALTIPTSSYYAYFSFYGLANGTDTLIVSAPGYLPDTAFVTVTTPKFTNCCMPGGTTTTNPPIGMTVYATDSLGNGHYASDTVVVAAVSSDTTVIRPTQPFFRILKDAYYASTTVTVVGPGTANITYSDSAGTGYGPTTTSSITVTGPSLGLSNGTPMLGMRQTGGATGSYVYVPNNVAADLVVNLLSTDPRVVTVPASVTIPAGSYYAYFQVTAQDTVGTIQVQASAIGYNAASTNVQVTQPKFVISTSTQAYTTSQPPSMTIYATDANGNSHYVAENVTITLLSSSPSVANIDSTTVTIPTGGYYHNTAHWVPGQVGTAQLSASDARAAYYKYNTGTANVAVVTPYLSFSWSTRYLGIGQYDDYAYASTPDYQAAPLTVAFSHVGTPRTSTFANLTTTPITGITIPAGNYYQYFRLAGTSTGADTLVASATSPAHIPDSAYTIVDLGRVDPLGGWPTTLAVGDSALVTLYARDQNQNTHYVLAATTFTLAPNANIEFRSGGSVITQVTILADQQYVQFYVKGVSAGTGSVNITATDYQTYSTTVTVQ